MGRGKRGQEKKEGTERGRPVWACLRPDAAAPGESHLQDPAPRGALPLADARGRACAHGRPAQRLWRWAPASKRPAGGAITGTAGAPQGDAECAGGGLRGLGACGPGWRKVFSVHLGKRPHLLQIRRAPFALGILERVLPLIQRSLQNHLSGRPEGRFLRIRISALPFTV